MLNVWAPDAKIIFQVKKGYGVEQGSSSINDLKKEVERAFWSVQGFVEVQVYSNQFLKVDKNRNAAISSTWSWTDVDKNS